MERDYATIIRQATIKLTTILVEFRERAPAIDPAAVIVEALRCSAESEAQFNMRLRSLAKRATAAADGPNDA